MAQYGKSFTYNGRSSSEFDMVIAGFQVMDIPLNLKRSTSISSMNRYRHQVNMYGINYDSVLGFTIQLIKDPCKYTEQTDLRFTRAEIHEIAAWLTSPISPRLFHMTDYPKTQRIVVPVETETEDIITTYDEETGEETYETVIKTVIANIIREENITEEEYDYMGVFTNLESADDHIYCLECTFECNTPYALSSEQTFTFENGEGIINNPSDEYEDYVYPKIIITPTGNELSAYDIRLINESDVNRSITLKNMKPGDTVTMDCRKLTVVNQSGSLMSFEDMNVDVVDYIYWFRLLHGENKIKISGDARVQFIFRYPVKVGAY